jgi:hypothetical protein
MIACPFCGSPETDRIDLEGKRFLVFACMFTPEVDPALPDSEVPRFLAERFTREGSGSYFRAQCDRMHLFVAKGEGARTLLGKGAGRDQGSVP